MVDWQNSPSTPPPLTAANLDAAFAEKLDVTVASATYAPVVDGSGNEVVRELVDFRMPNADWISFSTSHYTALRSWNSGDAATRFMLLPKFDVVTGNGPSFKIMADRFDLDDVNYRDVGLYFSADQLGDTGLNGEGVWWLNGKSWGTHLTTGNPDIGIGFQDGTYVAAKFMRYNSPARAVTLIGMGAPVHAGTRTNIRLEVHGDMALDTDRSLWWSDAAGASSNRAEFGINFLTFTVSSVQALKLKPFGGVVFGTTAQLATTATTGFIEATSMAGTPTGTPTYDAGKVPIVFDTTGSKLWAYIGGSWKSATFA